MVIFKMETWHDKAGREVIAGSSLNRECFLVFSPLSSGEQAFVAGELT